MLIFYLAGLLFGGILLGVSLLSGGGDMDGTDALDSAHTDFDSLDADTDLDFDSETSIEHIDLSDSDLSHEIENPADAVKFISFRNIIYFTTFYGLTGTLFTLMGFQFILTFASAIGIGSLSWFTGHKLMRYLKNSESGEALNSKSFIGKEAKVVVATRKDKIGKVLVKSNNEINELMVKVSDSAEKESFDRGETVFIIDYRNNIYFIIGQQQF